MGKKCTAILNTFIKFVFSGNSKEAAEELVKLKEDGSLFAAQIDRLLCDQETLESYFIMKETNSKHDIIDCLQKLLLLKEEQADMLSKKERNTVILFHYKSKVEQTLEELTYIEQTLKILSKDTNDRNTVSAALSASGVLTSTLAGGNIQQLTKEIHAKEAARNVALEQYRSECNITEDTIVIIQENITERKTQISSLENKLKVLQKEKETYYKKVSKIKEKVAFLEQAVEFWSLMQLLSDKNVDYTKLTNVVFKKATEKTRVSLPSKITKKLPRTFIEAWDSELVQAERGFSHVLHFTFTCSKCGGTHTSMPHIVGNSLHCKACHDARKKSPMR